MARKNAGKAAAIRSERLNYLIVGLLLVAVGLIVFDRYLGDGSAALPQAANAAAVAPPNAAPASSSATANDVQPLSKSVAVLPLANLSPRAEDAYFAAGIHDEILNQLVKLKSLNVIARTSVLQYANTQKTIQEIGRELGVQTVLEGSVRYADQRVLVTAQLIDAATNVHLWSESYERPFSNIFAIQADVAMNVANALRAEFTLAEQEYLERLPTSSLEAYELYLTAQDRNRSGLSMTGPNSAIEALENALAIDPAFVQAWILKANIHGFISQTASAARYAAEDEAMVAAARRAAELAPEMPEAQALLATAHGRRGEWLAAEAAFQRTNAAPAAAARHGLHLASVGRLEQAQDLVAIARRTDPFNNTVRGFYLLGFALLGDQQRAEQEYARGISAFGNPWPLGSWFITMARVRLDQPLSQDEVPPGIGSGSAQHYIRDHLDDPQSGLALLRETARNEDIGIDQLSLIALWGAYFGDPELALASIERATSRNAQNAFLLWLPAMRDVRQLPRFKAFVSDVGLVDYWRRHGWPTLCRPAGNNDITCS